ncbi:MAG: AGE family epimerase/isomerase [Sedimentisphaerales bacterium]|jgi:mannobiose 2-epimerase|nr:AGE family epimerase/isomerase [Planctomycetota bacterium]MDY0357468.1 AGE family epimerase/isomerase [Sedimentisphaerales bacterium]NLT78620.1 N-acylglucosamine 2-epimerase [Planctomycetota bacterium]
MGIDRDQVSACLDECKKHFTTELLPFWLDRCKDDANGGFITHFDKDGKDTGEDEKSALAQLRTVYSMSAAHRAGFGGGRCAEYARHGVDFLIEKVWDKQHGGFYWTTNRKGEVAIDKKIMYGLSFGMYAMAEYTLATGDPRGQEYAEKTFDLVKKYAADTMYGGYFEMFERNWDLCGPGPQGGDRKTLDVHMHLMEAFTTLYECTGKSIHRRTLLEDIDLLFTRILHPKYATGIPQFTVDWKVAPQIKFDIVWGWDRFAEGGAKPNAEDNTSAGHNVEFAWLLAHATDVLGGHWDQCKGVIKKAMDHGRDNGIDPEFGGVYTEGPHAGGVYDMEKEFWQQAEVMIGMLEGCLRFGPAEYWPSYLNVHRFVFDKMIHHPVGEWWPLTTREGQPIWTHMSHSWKVNYHTIRCMIECIRRLEKLQASL